MHVSAVLYFGCNHIKCIIRLKKCFLKLNRKLMLGGGVVVGWFVFVCFGFF